MRFFQIHGAFQRKMCCTFFLQTQRMAQSMFPFSAPLPLEHVCSYLCYVVRTVESHCTQFLFFIVLVRIRVPNLLRERLQGQHMFPNRHQKNLVVSFNCHYRTNLECAFLIISLMNILIRVVYFIIDGNIFRKIVMPQQMQY